MTERLYHLTILCLLVCACSLHAKSIGQEPEQIHLSIGDSVSSLVVTWVTSQQAPTPTVKYGQDESLSHIATGFSRLFVDGGDEKRQFFIHRVKLTDMEPIRQYTYICGSSGGWSERLHFRSLPQHSSWSPRLAIFGDLGVENGQSVPELVKEVQKLDSFDAILHVGDFAYDMHDDNGRVGDAFMRMIEPLASRVPYMTAVGNHEDHYNFSHYKERFSMPGGDNESQFYSFSIGPVHVVGFSSEFYYYPVYFGDRHLAEQYRWLQADLSEANQPKNRMLQPWIIAMGHRPMYCSNNDDAMHCDKLDNFIRTGIPTQKGGEYQYGLEELFYRHGVDIVIGAHEHSYERFWPVYNRTVCNGTHGDPYLEPEAPVHIVTGSAGCSEGFDPFTSEGKPWSAFRIDSYGFTRMHIHNGSHVSVEQVSVDRPGTPVIDAFTIVKSSHGPGLYTCHLSEKPAVIPWNSLFPARLWSFDNFNGHW